MIINIIILSPRPKAHHYYRLFLGLNLAEHRVSAWTVRIEPPATARHAIGVDAYGKKLDKIKK